MAFVRLTRRNVAALKRWLIEALPQAKSGHADEALAAGIGFNTHASLLAALAAQGATATVTVMLDEKAVADRLGALGGRVIEPIVVARALFFAELPDEGPWTEITKLRKNGAANEN